LRGTVKSKGEKPFELLRRGLAEICPETDPETLFGRLHLLDKFLNELELWNRRVSLVSGDPRDIVVRHLLDSLAAYPVLKNVLRTGKEETGGGSTGENPEEPPVGGGGKAPEIADIGSGNGFPAIPLALWDETLRISLVERGGKKASYLRNAVGILGLGGRVEVVERDLREMDRQYRIVISRAFMPMSSAVPLMRKTVGRTAVLLFYAGKRSAIDAELDILGKKTGKAAEVEILTVMVPFLEEERHICLFPPDPLMGRENPLTGSVSCG
jgi:16S rRNA (guanine527-N7)-methyltransferase